MYKTRYIDMHRERVGTSVQTSGLVVARMLYVRSALLVSTTYNATVVVPASHAVVGKTRLKFLSRARQCQLVHDFFQQSYIHRYACN